LIRGPVRRLKEWDVADPAARACLWAVAFWIAYRLQLRLEAFHTNWRELIYLLLACGLMVIAAWPGKKAEASPDEHAPEAGAPPSPDLPQRSLRSIAMPLAVLVAALVLGVFFRLYDLNSRPVGISFDEASNGLIARNIINGDYPPWFIGGNTQLPAAFFYIYALFSSYLGEDVLSLRLVSTIGGLAALPLLFLLAREIFDWRVAAIATFILAVMRWHVNFSRFGVTNIFAAALVTGAIAFFARGIRGRSRWNFVVAGVFVGLTPYAGFYGIFVPIVIGLYWLHTLLFDRILTIRRHLVAIVIVGAAALTMYAPVAGWGLMNGDEYLSRPGSASISKNKDAGQTYDAVVTSTKKHLLMFNSRGDRNGRHNLPNAPMLDRFTGILFILGVGLAATRLRRSNHFLLLVWVIVFLQNGIWSVDFEAPQSFRSSAVTPAVAMLAALPLAALWAIAARALAVGADGEDSIAHRFSLLQYWGVRIGATVTLAVLLGFIADRNYDTYFNKQLDHPQVWRDFNTDIAFVAQELKNADPDQTILLSSLFSSPVIDYVDKDTVDRNKYQLDLIRDVPVSGDGSALMLLDVTKKAYVDWIQQLYPAGRVTKFGPPGEGGEIHAYKVEIPAESVRELQGLEATYQRPGSTSIQRREPNLDVNWAVESPPLPFPFRGRWSGTVRILEAGGAALTVVAPGQIALFIDDQEVARGADRVVSPSLYRGLHRIRIEADVERPGRLALINTSMPVSADNLFSGQTVDRRRGLVATFYQGGEFSGSPLQQELDPFVAFRYHAELSFGSPFSVIWKGSLDVETAGPYLFRIEPTGEAQLTIDGQPIIPFPGRTDGNVTLAPGEHEIELRYVNLTGFAAIYLRWQPPGGVLDIIPSENLKP
jgi:4-amino-4-deoxy-L-arabinose transferase-like glycosyltransferase